MKRTDVFCVSTHAKVRRVKIPLRHCAAFSQDGYCDQAGFDYMFHRCRDWPYTAQPVNAPQYAPPSPSWPEQDLIVFFSSYS